MKSRLVEISPEEIERLAKKFEAMSEQDSDYEVVHKLLLSYLTIIETVRSKNATIKRLQKLIFGAKSEKQKTLLREKKKRERELTKGEKKKAKGHGRKKPDEYKNAEIIKVPHNDLKSGDICPECNTGKVYIKNKKPTVLIRITGNPPFTAKRYELETFRCNVCDRKFTARLPAGVSSEKYDERAKALAAILRYGSGFPHYRLDALQNSLGHPFPDSNQWEAITSLYEKIRPVYKKLVYLAAQGDIIHNDDTNMKITSLMNTQKELYEKQKHRAVFTSGFVSANGEQKIGLYYTGTKHAGENIITLLKKRKKKSKPIQMCDALTRNYLDKISVILAHCLAHGRRYFIELILLWPEKAEHVIKQIGKIYKNEKHIRRHKLSTAERLIYHKTHSAPVMVELRKWLQEQFDKKEVEPNSDLGKAITYILKHWKELTVFLRDGRAPLDNNICEQVGCTPSSSRRLRPGIKASNYAQKELTVL